MKTGLVKVVNSWQDAFAARKTSLEKPELFQIATKSLAEPVACGVGGGSLVD